MTSTVSASALGSGVNAVRICVTDAAGNTGSAAGTVTKDTTPPTVTINGIAPTVIGAGQTATLTWHANENGSFRLLLGGTDCSSGAQIAAGTYSSEPTTIAVPIAGSALSPGSNTLRVCSSDAAGNTGSKTTKVSLDSTAPTVAVSKPVNGGTYAVGQSVKASYSCKDESGGSGLATCVGTVANGAAIDTATVGSKSFVVTATDKGGNTTTTTVHYEVS